MFPPRHADPPSDTDACVSLSQAADAELKDNSEPLRFCEGAQSTGVNIVLDLKWSVDCCFRHRKSSELPTCHACSESEHRDTLVWLLGMSSWSSLISHGRGSCHLLPGFLEASCAPPPAAIFQATMAQSILLQLESTENLLRADGCFWKHAVGSIPLHLASCRRKLYREVLGRSTLGIPESKWLGV